MKTNSKRLVGLLLVVILVLSLIPMAAFAADKTSVWSTRDENQIYYDVSGITKYFWADGNQAFCLEPLKAGAANGQSYDITRYLDPEGSEQEQTLIKIAYYGFGGPGWSSAKEGLFGNSNDNEEMYALCHCAAAYVYGGEAGFNGLSQSMINHVTNMIGAFQSMGMPGVGFKAFIYNEGDAGTQTMLGWYNVPMGEVELTKVSANQALSDGNDCYTLEGAVYGIYLSDDTKVGTITTDADGKGKLENLEVGSYYALEESPPDGYALDDTKYIFDIIADTTTQVQASDLPQADPVGILLKKQDSGNGNGTPQGGASLANAEFTIKYYDGFYSTTAELNGETPERTWIFKTDADGFTYLDASYLVSGDSFYYNSTSAPTIPLGTISIQESKAPDGYLLNDELFIRQITSDGLTEFVYTYNEPVIPDDIIRGGVRIEKWDNEIDQNTAQGGGTLKGAVFEVVNRSAAAVFIDGVSYAPGDVITSLTTDDTGAASTAANLLPYGDYEAREITPPEAGYLATGVLSCTFSIREDGVIVDLNTSNTAIKNNPIRGDLKGVKIADGAAQRLANVPFKLTLLETGESHIIVTDQNGQIDTSSAWNPHSRNTNRGETAEDGVWFGEIGALNDGAGALLYGTYLMEEQPCEANEGMKLLSFEVFIYRNNTTVDLGTLTDDFTPTPEVFTTAMDKESTTNNAIASKMTTIVDTVYYSGLEFGKTYTVNGILMDKATGMPLLIDGKQITAERTFVSAGSGTVTMEFTFDSSALKGKSVVVFESVMEDEIEVAAHADINDEGQTVKFESPEISTTATEKGGEKELLIDTQTTIVDTVSYKGLKPGVAYILKGILMDKATVTPLMVDGKQVTAEKPFTPTESSGSVEVEFTFNSLALKGKEIVVYESLIQDGREVTTHADILDEGQTVKFKEPVIGTTATGKDGEKEIAPAVVTTIVDVVKFDHLKPGVEYILRGMLMDKTTGEPLLVDGKQVTVEKPFTPETASGSVEVEFTIDSSALKGKETVVFETLMRDNVEIAIHADISDAGQTVLFKEPGTPKTGDTENMIFPLAVAIAAGVVIGLVFVTKKRALKKNNG